MGNGAAPLNYFLHAHGPAAAPTMVLGWIFSGIAVAVCLVVAGLLYVAITRRRGGEPGLVRGRPGDARWVVIGTAISSAVLLAMTVYALVVLNQVGNRPAGDAVDIHVTAYDWWWRVDYPKNGQAVATTANELHIPVGTPVRLLLDSADVIHAFWVPQLAGKTQMIPGLRNEQWLQADTPGVYRGQCTQYCGVQHAHMALEVVAETPERYRTWLAAQSADAPGATADTVRAGRELFVERCGGCHAVRGTAAAGVHGPDLTHLLARRRIAAGALLNTPDNLMHWILHAQDIKPGTRMPSMRLDATETTQLAAFLGSLQ